ncbi:hypothetical protein SFC70_20860 [Bacillus subtilis]
MVKHNKVRNSGYARYTSALNSFLEFLDEFVSVLIISMLYFENIKKNFPDDWGNYKESKLTHIVCINALSILGSKLLAKCMIEESNQVDSSKLHKYLTRIKK